MISELDRRTLTMACGLEWHEQTEITRHGYPGTRCSCGLEWDWKDTGCKGNPTFSTADDWELVRVNVVVPNQEAFVVFLWSEETWPLNKWIALSCERKCQYAADFVKARPDLFPWVVEMENK